MQLIIDGQNIEIIPGTTILQAARQLGIEIPTLCYQEGLPHQTSCFLCVVKVNGNQSLTPACAAQCAEGMVVETDTAEILAARKTCLELLLSDHAGACVAACSMACPADLDIPGFTEPLAAGRSREAMAVIKKDLPFPAVLGRICPNYCESACMRKKVDETLSIRALHGLAAEEDLASGEPYQPPCKPASGKRVAIVGAGAAGLSAAYYLLQDGHECTVFEMNARAGGVLRHAAAEGRFPEALLDTEIGVIEKLGARIHYDCRLEYADDLEDLRKRFDAVLLAFGAWGEGAGTEKRKADLELIKELGLEAARKGIAIDKRSQATKIPGVFAAGEAASGAVQMVWVVAAGRNAAIAIDQYLNDQPVAGAEEPYYFWRKQQTEAEEELLYGRVPKTACALAGHCGQGGEGSVMAEAGRCLQCGCASAPDCRLRYYAARYGAKWDRFRGERRELAADESHPEILYEPGKCILCGLCIRIAEDAGEELGLTFAGRGFVTRVAPPLGVDLAHALGKAARACAAACPSGALTMKAGIPEKAI